MSTIPERKFCGRCHKCTNPVRYVLDGEEWCSACERYQRPFSHGWSSAYGDFSACVNLTTSPGQLSLNMRRHDEEAAV